MQPKIENITFLGLNYPNSRPRKPGDKVEVNQRAMLPGAEFILNKDAAYQFEMVTEQLCITRNVADLEYSKYESLKGKGLVPFTEPNGKIWNKVKVLEVDKVSLRNAPLVSSASAITAGWILSVRWLIMVVEE